MYIEYSVINSGIIEFYGSLNECVQYLVEKSQFVRENWQIRQTDSFYKGV